MADAVNKEKRAIIGSWQCPRCNLKSMNTWRGQPDPSNAPTCCGGGLMIPYRITEAERNTKIVSRWIDEIESAATRT